MPLFCEALTLLTETTILMKILATFGASSDGHQKDVAFRGSNTNSPSLAPLANFYNYSLFLKTKIPHSHGSECHFLICFGCLFLYY